MKKSLESDIVDFLHYLKEIRKYSHHTILTYETALQQMMMHSEYFAEDDKIVLDIMPLRLHIKNNHKKTITKKLSAIRSLIKYIATQKKKTINLLGDSSIKVPQSLPKPIEANYIDEILADSSLMEKLLISMLYGLGLRIGELDGLKLTQIQTSWIIIRGKGNKSRQLPLVPYLQNLISEYLTIYSPKIYLFEQDNKALNSAQLRYKIKKQFSKRGIKATPHQLRHSFATHLLNGGARISDVSELLGHSSMATTQIYTKLASSKKLDEYMKAHPLAQ